MCLQGTSQSGQEQYIDSSAAEAGNSASPSSAKTSSMSSGISPASSFAEYQALAASVRSAASHSGVPNASSPMRTRYGCTRLPWTSALTIPAVTSMERTWPRRA